MVRDDHLCAVFPREARNNRTSTEIKERAAEGKKRRTRKLCHLQAIAGCLFVLFGLFTGAWLAF